MANDFSSRHTLLVSHLIEVTTSMRNMDKKNYYASRRQILPLSIFTGIFACPFWFATLLFTIELFEFKYGIKSLFLIILIALLGSFSYFLSRKAILIFKNQSPILVLTQDKIQTIEFKGRGVTKKEVFLRDIAQVELKKTLLDRHYYLRLIMKDRSIQKLNLGLGLMHNNDIFDLKHSLDHYIPPKAKTYPMIDI
ncbi:MULTISPECIES: hypothetical protein [unclassified Acinetobacter]|uniref:hypothetical protein n=1 Tax=unclassified Acinetobacter TaxID=196816 RepID=UPI001D0E9E16|nr:MULTISPECIES: hypothetical protein [unclassified Acinetobacter]